MTAEEGRVRYFLVKTEPQVFSVDDLKRENDTVWDGVRNPQALKALRSMEKGDRVFVYHSGGSAAVVGLAEVSAGPRPDPRDGKLTVVNLRYLRHLDPPVSLAAIKETGRFAQWALIRQGRLSVMEAPAEFVDWIRERYRGQTI